MKKKLLGNFDNMLSHTLTWIVNLIMNLLMWLTIIQN